MRDEVGLNIDDSVLSIVATQITAGARELRGALNRLEAMSLAYGERSRGSWLSELSRIWLATARVTCDWRCRESRVRCVWHRADAAAVGSEGSQSQ